MTTPATNPTNAYRVPSVSITMQRQGEKKRINELGMRTMQERAYTRRGEQYLLIKSPPASGKSRALMFIALDKLHNQGLKQALIVVPEKSIGSSFADEPLTKDGFFADWNVEPQWNLCNAPGADDEEAAKTKVKAVAKFLESDSKVLVCTHSTFRFAVSALGVAAFENRLLAIDEFHHVSANPNSILGTQLSEFIEHDKNHIVAMTGSYFRGDGDAVLKPSDEARFDVVTYTYYEQINSYEWLKSLDLGYFFYTGPYVDAIPKVLDPNLKTIVHIPNVNAVAAMGNKYKEAEEVMGHLGEWIGVDEKTGFQLIKTATGKILKVADLVDDTDPARRSKVLQALKDPAQKNNREHVDVIVALGMAKEGFDWIWCEHALTVGYRSSLTEIVQIIGRATRDAPNKLRARFTNLIAEPIADQSMVVQAVNDMLKAISASLLMEQVLSPRYEFTPKDAGPKDGFDYGDAGYQPGGKNVGVNHETGSVHVEIDGIATPASKEAARICKEDLNEVLTSFLQDKPSMEKGLFDHEETIPEEITQVRMGKIIRDRYPELSAADQEAVRQHAIAALNLTQQGKLEATKADEEAYQKVGLGESTGAASQAGNTALIDGVRRFVNIADLDIDLIDRINPFDAAYSVLSKTMDENLLRQVQETISGKKLSIPEDEARELALRALKFRQERGRNPELTAQDPWERRMAEGVQALKGYVKRASQAAQGA